MHRADRIARVGAGCPAADGSQWLGWRRRAEQRSNDHADDNDDNRAGNDADDTCNHDADNHPDDAGTGDRCHYDKLVRHDAGAVSLTERKG